MYEYVVKLEQFPKASKSYYFFKNSYYYLFSFMLNALRVKHIKIIIAKENHVLFLLFLQLGSVFVLNDYYFMLF